MDWASHHLGNLPVSFEPASRRLTGLTLMPVRSCEGKNPPPDWEVVPMP